MEIVSLLMNSIFIMQIDQNERNKLYIDSPYVTCLDILVRTLAIIILSIYDEFIYEENKNNKEYRENVQGR